MKVPLLDLRAQFATLSSEIILAVEKVLEEQRFILGPEVQSLEMEVAAYCDAAYAVGVASGSDALLLSLMALGVGADDAVITTPYTFFATAGSLSRLDAVPIFVDIEPDTYNISSQRIRDYVQSGCDSKDGVLTDRRSGKRVSGILPVHLFGQCAEMDPIIEIAQDHGLWVVEDAAQAIGSRYKDRSAGTMGITGCFSFYPSKNLGGAGDGGMIVTNDESTAAQLRILREHGGESKYYHNIVGCNSRLDALQAAILRVKLPHLEQWSNQRAENAAAYDAGLNDVPGLVTPQTKPYNRSIFNQYVLRVEGQEGQRDRLKQHLTDKGIGCAIYYPVSLHLQECFRFLGYQEGDMPESERAARQTLAIPVYPELTREMIDYVISVVRDFMGA